MKLLRFFFSFGRLFVGAALLMAALLFGAAPAARATQTALVLDSGVNTTTTRSVTVTGSTPRTFMGGGYTLGSAAGTSNIALNGGTFYEVTGGAATYTDVQCTIYFWGSVNTSGTVNATTPAFSNLISAVTFDLGPQTTPAGTTFSSFNFTLATPVVVPTRTLGVTVAFKGDSGAGLVSDNNLTSLIRNGTPMPVGTSLFNGYYRNAAGEADGNFVSALRSLSGLTNQAIAIDLTATVPGPNVATSAATNVSATGATLNGTVNPGGLATTAKFQYGTTTAYGTDVPVTLSPNDGTTDQTVSLPITGLTANTLYHFRIAATNSAGTNVGADQTFTTSPASLSIGNVSQTEGNSGTTNFVFPVTLSAASGSAVSVNYAVSDGSATAGSDYGTASDSDGGTPGVLTIAAGATSGTITVPVVGDTTFEPDETFTVTLSSPTGATLGTPTVGTGTILNDDTAADTSGAVISQFRLSGPGAAGNGSDSALDEFIEVANITTASLNVSGWSVVSSSGVTIPLSGSIPAKGRLLLSNSGGYSLSAYATGDITYTGDIAPGSTLSLRNAVPVEVDAVGNLSLIAAPTSATSDYAYLRRLDGGAPRDTDMDTSDFTLVDVGSTGGGTATGLSVLSMGARLGAPGPHSLSSPIQRNAGISSTPLNPGAGFNPIARYGSRGNTSVDKQGRLSLRRNIKNNTGAAVTQMRFRLVALTSGTGPSGVADLRAITSAGVMFNGAQVAQGVTLEAPSSPVQTPLPVTSTGKGGGLNSSWTVALPGGTLAPGDSIGVEFLFGIQTEGGYRIVIDTELLP